MRVKWDVDGNLFSGWLHAHTELPSPSNHSAREHVPRFPCRPAFSESFKNEKHGRGVLKMAPCPPTWNTCCFSYWMNVAFAINNACDHTSLQMTPTWLTHAMKQETNAQTDNARIRVKLSPQNWLVIITGHLTSLSNTLKVWDLEEMSESSWRSLQGRPIWKTTGCRNETSSCCSNLQHMLTVTKVLILTFNIVFVCFLPMNYFLSSIVQFSWKVCLFVFKGSQHAWAAETRIFNS